MTSFSHYIKSLVIPTMLLIVILIATALLITQRDILLTYEKNFLGKSIHEKPILIQDTQWTNYYSGGAGMDRVVSYNGASLRVTTHADGAWYGARTSIKKTDFSDKALRFAVRADRWEDLESFMILIATDGGIFNDYYSLNLKEDFVDPLDKEWIEVVIDRSEFVVGEGSPDWSHVTAIGVRVVPVEGTATRVWIDGFASVDVADFSPIVTLAFDEGFDSVFEAAIKMKEYGYAGTAYVVPGLVDTEGYISQEQVDLLSKEGWDISAHSKINLRELSYSDVDTELASIYSYFNFHDYVGSKNFAYSDSAYDRSIQSQVLEYFNTGLSFNGFAQPQGYLLPGNINSKKVSASTTVDEISSWIESAQKNKSWLVIVWGDFDNDSKEDMGGFVEILEYLRNKNIHVNTLSEVYKSLAEHAVW